MKCAQHEGETSENDINQVEVWDLAAGGPSESLF